MAAAEEKQVAGLATRRSSRHDLRHDPEPDPGIDGGLAREPNVATQGDTVGPPIATPPHPLLGQAESKETVTRRFPEGKPASVRAPDLPLWDAGRAPEPGFRPGRAGVGGTSSGRPEGCLTAGGLGSLEAVRHATLDRPGAGMGQQDAP